MRDNQVEKEKYISGNIYTHLYAYTPIYMCVYTCTGLLVYIPLCICVCVYIYCASAGKESACNAGDLGSVPGLGRRERLTTAVFWPREFHELYSP